MRRDGGQNAGLIEPGLEGATEEFKKRFMRK